MVVAPAELAFLATSLVLEEVTAVVSSAQVAVLDLGLLGRHPATEARIGLRSAAGVALAAVVTFWAVQPDFAPDHLHWFPPSLCHDDDLLAFEAVAAEEEAMEEQIVDRAMRWLASLVLPSSICRIMIFSVIS